MPRGRTDLAAGSAVRVPVGDMVALPGGSPSDRALTQAAAGGVAPAAFVRHGLARDVDLGLEASGVAARAHLRGRLRFGLVNLVLGIAPHVGLAHEAGELGRVGGTVPVVLAIDVTSLYEVWVGVRVGAEHVFGRVGAETISITGLRTGGVVGLAAGFRRFHVLLELGIDHELWTGSLDTESVERNGLVLTPAFAFRLRL